MEDRELGSAVCSLALHVVVFKTHVVASSPVQFLQATVVLVAKSQSFFWAAEQFVQIDLSVATDTLTFSLR